MNGREYFIKRKSSDPLVVRGYFGFSDEKKKLLQEEMALAEEKNMPEIFSMDNDESIRKRNFFNKALRKFNQRMEREVIAEIKEQQREIGEKDSRYTQYQTVIKNIEDVLKHKEKISSEKELVDCVHKKRDEICVLIEKDLINNKNIKQHKGFGTRLLKKICDIADSITAIFPSVHKKLLGNANSLFQKKTRAEEDALCLLAKAKEIKIK